jgi:putative transposase
MTPDDGAPTKPDPSQSRLPNAAPDLVVPADAQWEEARRRHALIMPIIENARLSRVIIRQRAAEAGVAPSTLYRWARAFRAFGTLSSLLPAKPNGGRGKSRLDPAVEKIIAQTIEEYFLTKQQRSIFTAAREVLRRCLAVSVASIPSC